MSRMLKIWPSSKKFLKALGEINSKDYIKETSNYRNFTAHTIGPRIGIGHTRTVTRYLEPARALKQVGDGTYVYEILPSELTVSYGIGGMPPLDLEAVFAANLVEYEKARSCYLEYRALLETAVAEIVPLNKE
ncbi:hypothetical protein NBRC116187_25410 [Halopseudomonas sabulinigri]|uniref:Uncharacterized protein n=1 Tax=Halopseudomonas sabulinigri TaxID=472181 RepID=A0ABP9ZRT6_9GAMM